MKRVSIKITNKPKTRMLWGFNPATRVVKSKRIYSRKKFTKREFFEQIDKL